MNQPPIKAAADRIAGFRARLTAGLTDHLRRHEPAATAAILEVLADCSGYIIARCCRRRRDEAALRFVARVIFHADHYAHDGGRAQAGLPRPVPPGRRR